MVLCWYIIGWNTDQILASWVGLCFVQSKFGENYYSLHVSCTDYFKSLTFVSLLELTVHNFYNMMMEWSNAWRILLNCLNEILHDFAPLGNLTVCWLTMRWLIFITFISAWQWYQCNYLHVMANIETFTFDINYSWTAVLWENATQLPVVCGL